jgi:Flp pilus assembly protein TadG
MDTTPHAGERGGAVGVEMALIWIAMLALVAAATQVALVFYAGQLALTAAQDGVHAGATQDPAAAQEAAQSFLARASGTAFTPTAVTVSVELTELGRAKHAEMRRAVQTFNRRLLAGLSEAEVEELRGLLGRLEQNVRS